MSKREVLQANCGLRSEHRRHGSAQHVERAKRQIHDLKEGGQGLCSHSVRHLRYAQSDAGPAESETFDLCQFLMQMTVVEADILADGQFDYPGSDLFRDRVAGLSPMVAVMHPSGIDWLVNLLHFSRFAWRVLH